MGNLILRAATKCGALESSVMGIQHDVGMSGSNLYPWACLARFPKLFVSCGTPLSSLMSKTFQDTDFNGFTRDQIDPDASTHELGITDYERRNMGLAKRISNLVLFKSPSFDSPKARYY